MVGKSRRGIVYTVGGRGSGVAGTVVAVRRLSEGNTTWRLKEFEAEVEAVSRVQHPNMVRLRAYYYANDEKLLVLDFIGNGSLYTALHGINPSLDAVFIRIVNLIVLMIRCIAWLCIVMMQVSILRLKKIFQVWKMSFKFY